MYILLVYNKFLFEGGRDMILSSIRAFKNIGLKLGLRKLLNIIYAYCGGEWLVLLILPVNTPLVYLLCRLINTT